MCVDKIKQLKSESKEQRIKHLFELFQAYLHLPHFCLNLGKCHTGAETHYKLRKSEESSPPLAEIVRSLTSLNKTEHQAFLHRRQDQEQRIQDLLEAQAADKQVFQLRSHATCCPRQDEISGQPGSVLRAL